MAPTNHAVYFPLQRELAKGWRVPATVFYDRPPDFFRPATLEVRCCSTIVRNFWPVFWQVHLCNMLTASIACYHCQLPAAHHMCLHLPILLPPSQPSSSTPPQQTHELLLKLAPALSQPLHPADFVAELYASGQLAPGQTPCTVRPAWCLRSVAAAATGVVFLPNVLFRGGPWLAPEHRVVLASC